MTVLHKLSLWISHKDSRVISLNLIFFQTFILSRQKKEREEKKNVIICHAFSESVLTGVCKAVLPFFLSLSGSFYLILVVSDHFIVWWEWSNCAFFGSLWVKVSKWSTWWYLSFCCDCLLYLFIEVILDAGILYRS